MSEIFGALIDLWPATVLVSLVVAWYGWKRLTGSLRVFVMMAGGAVFAFLVMAALHNAVWWLSVRLWGPPGVEEPVFFLAAIIGCPLLLAVGAVGALMTWLRQRGVQR